MAHGRGQPLRLLMCIDKQSTRTCHQGCNPAIKQLHKEPVSHPYSNLHGVSIDPCRTEQINALSYTPSSMRVAL